MSGMRQIGPEIVTGKKTMYRANSKNDRIEFLAAIEIEQITHRLEGPERKPQGQREMRELLQRREGKCTATSGRYLKPPNSTKFTTMPSHEDAPEGFRRSHLPNKKIDHRGSEQELRANQRPQVR